MRAIERINHVDELRRQPRAASVPLTTARPLNVYHWSEAPALTTRERARLQTFPDQYVFEGEKEAVRRQIGMAVPPRGAAVVFKALLKSMLRQDYESVPSNLGARYSSLSEQRALV